MFEYFIIAVLVLWSMIIVFKKVLPKTSNSILLKVSDRFKTLGWNKLAEWFKPKLSSGCAGGCGCSSPEKTDSKNDEVKSVKWH